MATIILVLKQLSVTCLKDYWSVALTPIVTKCFKQLVMRHIKSNCPIILDPFQYTYCHNCSADDTISDAIQLCLPHLDKKHS